MGEDALGQARTAFNEDMAAACPAAVAVLAGVRVYVCYCAQALLLMCRPSAATGPKFDGNRRERERETSSEHLTYNNREYEAPGQPVGNETRRMMPNHR